MVGGKQRPRAEALDLERSAELTADRVEHPVRRRDEEREVDGEDGGGNKRQDGCELPALVLPALVTDSLTAFRVGFAAEMALAGAVGVLLLAAGTRSKRVRITPPSSSGRSATTDNATRRSATPVPSRPRPAARTRTPIAPASAISAAKTTRKAVKESVTSAGTTSAGSAPGGYSNAKSRYGTRPSATVSYTHLTLPTTSRV